MEEIRTYCFQIPKIELHSHLNGTVRDSTLTQLINQANLAKGLNPIELPKTRYLEDCFLLFSYIHSVVTDLNILKRIMIEAIEDFAQENVVYLELRTTPKNFETSTKRQYVQTLIDVIKEHALCQSKKITVKLLLSINRAYSIEEAEDTVELAHQFILEATNNNEHPIVVGVELSGNPTVGSFESFIPVLTKARNDYNMPISVHFAELANYEESKSILNFNPNRLGHGCHLNEELEQKVIESQIPLEICLSSNVLCGNFSTFESHIFIDLYNKNYPLSLCTDDHAIFSTTLSNEFYLAASSFKLTRTQLKSFTYATINYIFAPQSYKDTLKSTFDTIFSSIESEKSS